MSEKEVNQPAETQPLAVRQSRNVSRRALLKNAAVGMPAILTLHSGAALARSSNLIGPASYDAEDRLGRTLCLDLNSVTPVTGAAEIYDLGDPAFAHVYAIEQDKFHLQPDYSSPSVGASTACESGTTVYYRDQNYWYSYDSYSRDDDDGYTHDGDHYDSYTNWKQVRMNGIVVSSTALASFAGNISVTDI